MNHPQDPAEEHVLQALHHQPRLTMEGLVHAVPHISWNRVFHAVDALSRRGRIAVHRHGFEYLLSLPVPHVNSMPPAA